MKRIMTARWQGQTTFGQQNVQASNQYGCAGTSNRYTLSISSNNFRAWPVSAPGVISNLRVHLRADAPTCGLDSLTFQLRKNGSTVLSIPFTGTTIDLNDTTPISVAAGDQLEWRAVPSPTFPSPLTFDFPETMVSFDFDSEGDNVSIYWTRGVSTAPSTGYNSPFCGADDFGDSGDRFSTRDVITVPGNITRYDILLEQAPNVRGTSVTFALVIDGVVQDGSGGTVDTRVTLTSSTTATWTGTLPLDPSTQTFMEFRQTSSGFGGTGETIRISYCMKFEATTPGQWWMGGHTGILPSATDVEYQIVTANDISHIWETTQTKKEMVGALTTFRVRGLRVWSRQAPGVGRSRTFDLIVNGVVAVPTPVAVLADTNTSAEDVTGNITTITDADTWSLRCTPAGAPSILNDGLSWAFLADLPPIPPPECPGELGPARTDGLPYSPNVPPPCAGDGLRGAARTGT